MRRMRPEEAREPEPLEADAPEPVMLGCGCWVRFVVGLSVRPGRRGWKIPGSRIECVGCMRIRLRKFQKLNALFNRLRKESGICVS